MRPAVATTLRPRDLLIYDAKSIAITSQRMADDPTLDAEIKKAVEDGWIKVSFDFMRSLTILHRI